MQSWLGILLAVSVALQLVGTFVRYWTVGPFPSASGLPPTPGYSFSLYDAHVVGPAYLLTIASMCTLAYLLTRRPDHLYACVAAGFCASRLASLPFLVLRGIEESRTFTLGPGFYLVIASVAIVALVAVGATWIERPLSRPSSRVSPLCRALGIAAAVTVSVSTLIVDLRVPYGPLTVFEPLSLKSATAATFALVVLGAFPLAATRMRGRSGFWLLLGLAASEAIRVLDAVLRRFENTPPRAHLTIGWWTEILAVVLLVALASQLQPRETDANLATATNGT